MEATKVITPKESKVRFSYVHVFAPHAMEEGQTKKYSVCLLISKKDKKLIERFKAAIEAAKEAGKVKFGGKIPAVLKLPLRDGDEERPDDENYAGMMFINANATKKPGVLDADGVNQIMDSEEFYSGCYGRASVTFYAFNTSGNKGIACGLNNVQKTEEGERLSGGGASAEDDFGDGSDDDLG